MRTLSTVIWMAALAVAAAGCGQKTPAPEPKAAAPVPAAVPVAPALPAAPTVATMPPEVAAILAKALADAQAFEAKTPATLASIAQAERRIRLAAGRAAQSAGQGQAAGVGAARTEAEAAHAGLATGLAAFRSAADAQAAVITSALGPCLPAAPPAPGAPVPVATTPAVPGAAVGPVDFSADPACVALNTELATLTQTVAAVTQRYDAAEAVYQKERVKLDEASATIALSAAAR